MNELKKFYTAWLRVTTIGIGFFCALIAANLPGIPTRVAVSGVTLGLMFVVAEWFIREKMWRWRIFHCLLNFEGIWNCVTYYEEVEIRNAKLSESFKPYPKPYDAVIEQDTRQIRISSSQGSEYKGWKSLMMDATSSGVAYAYTVEYAASSQLKGKPTGYEKLSVQQREPDTKSGLPILLVGTFAHCADGQDEVYRGTAVFCRSNFLDLIKTKESMDPHVKKSIEMIRNDHTQS